jgi:transposase
MSTLESTGKKKPRPRRSFTPECKAEMVELCLRGDRSIGQVTKDSDLTGTAVRLWVNQAQVDDGERDGLTSAERDELVQQSRSPHRDLRVHRGLVRRPPPAQHPGGLQQPRRLRDRPRGLTDTTTVSVKAEQAHCGAGRR